MHKKVKMTLQRAKNLAHVKQHYGDSFYKEKYMVDNKKVFHKSEKKAPKIEDGFTDS